MSADDLARMLDIIVSRAPQLRDVGVLSVTIGDSAFTLAAAEPATAAPEVAAPEAIEEPSDIMRSPWTHGVPGKDSPSVVAPRRRKV